jgi:hypothetical protein
MAEYSYQIATGWDNEVDFDNVEDLVPSSGNTIPSHNSYFVVKAYNTYRRGQRRFSPNAASSFVGLKQVTWVIADADAEAYEWLYETYEGQVTIRTTTGTDGAYSNWNAYARFPDPADLAEATVGRYENIEVIMVLVETT